MDGGIDRICIIHNTHNGQSIYMKTKKTTLVITSALVLLCLIAAPASAAGSGTSADPYIITTADELQSMSNDLAAYYVLGNNIDLTGYAWTPIGSSTTPTANGFHGTLDGQGYAISNLSINTNVSYAGLFSVITTGATLANIDFVDCMVNGTTYVGTLFGACLMASGVNVTANILNIDTENCNVTASGYYVGGIAGYSGTYASVKFASCDVANGAVTSTSGYSVGGIAGYGATSNSQARFDACHAFGMHVKASGNYVGGIAGYGANSNSQASFENGCSAVNCLIESTSGHYVGGIAGYGAYSNSQASFENGCSAVNCVLKGGTNVGGIAGAGAHSNSQASFENCVAKLNSVRATNSYAGGIAGRIYDGCIGTFTDCISQYNSIVTGNYGAGICPAWA